MRELHHLVKRQPDMFQDHSWELAEESPDWYREVDWREHTPVHHSMSASIMQGLE